MSIRPEELSAKEQIVKAAQKVFAEKGFSGATVKDLSRAAGVNVAMISYYFEGKEGLYRACIQSFGLARLSFVEKILRDPHSAEDFRSKLHLWVEHFLDVNIEEMDAARIVHREFDSSMEHAKDIFRDTFLVIFKKITEFFATATERGYLRADLDPVVAVSTLFGALSHAVRCDRIAEEFFGRTLKDAVYRAKVAEQITRLLCQGLFNQRVSS